jgi:hypothetical protein
LVGCLVNVPLLEDQVHVVEVLSDARVISVVLSQVLGNHAELVEANLLFDGVLPSHGRLVRGCVGLLSLDSTGLP